MARGNPYTRLIRDIADAQDRVTALREKLAIAEAMAGVVTERRTEEIKQVAAVTGATVDVDTMLTQYRASKGTRRRKPSEPETTSEPEATADASGNDDPWSQDSYAAV